MKSADAFFTVLASTRRPPGPARLGLAIAKKQARRAVDRSRLKRIARETFRRHRAQLPDVDLVILARAAALGVGNPRLITSLERHFIRIGQTISKQQAQFQPPA